MLPLPALPFSARWFIVILMKFLFGLFCRLFLGLLAAMGLIRVLEMQRSPGTLAALTLLGAAAIYAGYFLRPRGE